MFARLFSNTHETDRSLEYYLQPLHETLARLDTKLEKLEKEIDLISLQKFRILNQIRDSIPEIVTNYKIKLLEKVSKEDEVKIIYDCLNNLIFSLKSFFRQETLDLLYTPRNCNKKLANIGVGISVLAASFVGLFACPPTIAFAAIGGTATLGGIIASMRTMLTNNTPESITLLVSLLECLAKIEERVLAENHSILFPNLYQKLESNRSATQEQIKNKYRELSKKAHPDTGGDQEKFTALQEAYKTLSDLKAKKEYDLRFDKFYPNGYLYAKPLEACDEDGWTSIENPDEEWLDMSKTYIRNVCKNR